MQFAKSYPLVLVAGSPILDLDLGYAAPGPLVRELANGNALSMGLDYLDGAPTAYRVVIDAESVDGIEALVDGYFAAWDPSVPHRRAVVIATIDAETGRRIAAGHEWPAASGKRFSLSAIAQINTLGLYTFADPALGVFVYPYTIRTTNNLASHALADADEARAFAVSAATTISSIVLGGRTVGLAVLAAETSAEIEAAAAAWLAGE